MMIGKLTKRFKDLNWTLVVLVIIMILLVINLATPEYKKRQYAAKLRKLSPSVIWYRFKPKTEYSYDIVWYKCDTPEDKAAMFPVKETVKIFKMLNKEMKRSVVSVEDYYGEKDVLKITDKYDLNDTCEIQYDRMQFFNTYVSVPKPYFID